MSIEFEILGAPGKDNVLLVLVNSGQKVNRFLFDCGEGCLSKMPVREIQVIDQLFFSHLHIDHISDFDSFFRCNFNFHLSNPYSAEEHREILEEARTVFPDTFFPNHWNI